MGKSRRILPFVVATLPIQLNKYFFTDSSFVLGIPIDYLAISIYLSDFAIILYLIIFVLDNYKKPQTLLAKSKNFLIPLLILNIYFIANSILTSKSPQTSAFSSLKFLEFSLFTLFASVDFSDKKTMAKIKMVATVTLLWQSLLIVLQFLYQKSLGLWFLGERSFDGTTPSIAQTNILERQFLRPYGTFPHPNVLGACLVFFLIIISADLFKNNQEIAKLKRLSYQKIAVGLSLVACLLIYSKTALFILILIPLIYSKNIKNIIIATVLIILVVVFYINFISYSHITSIAERLILTQAAYKIALINPLFGIGAGNFIAELAKLNLISISEVRLLQPVHNMFLLVIVENGIFGLILLANYLFAIQRKVASTQKLILFLALMLYFSVDHFLWTLQQGQFLFAIVSAYILSSPQKTTITKTTA